MLKLDAAAVRRSLRETANRIDRSSHAELRNAVTLARQVAAQRAPGRIGKTLRITPVGPNELRLESTWRKAGYLEFGTRRHPIAPRRAGGRLVFQVNGSWVFARRVNHPGNKPFRFMQAGQDAGERHLTVFAAGIL